MPLSPEFVQFLVEGDITVDDYNSLSTAEKISAVAKFRSSAPAPGNYPYRLYNTIRYDLFP